MKENLNASIANIIGTIKWFNQTGLNRSVAWIFWSIPDIETTQAKVLLTDQELSIGNEQEQKNDLEVKIDKFISDVEAACSIDFGKDNIPDYFKRSWESRKTNTFYKGVFDWMATLGSDFFSRLKVFSGSDYAEYLWYYSSWKDIVKKLDAAWEVADKINFAIDFKAYLIWILRLLDFSNYNIKKITDGSYDG